MNPRSDVFAECAWCGRPIRYGNAAVTVTRSIEQVDWNEQLEDGAITVIESDALLVLCAGCGNRLDLERVRRFLLQEGLREG
jgi:hypothetical protein